MTPWLSPYIIAPQVLRHLELDFKKGAESLKHLHDKHFYTSDTHVLGDMGTIYGYDSKFKLYTFLLIFYGAFAVRGGTLTAHTSVCDRINASERFL